MEEKEPQFFVREKRKSDMVVFIKVYGLLTFDSALLSNIYGDLKMQTKASNAFDDSEVI